MPLPFRGRGGSRNAGHPGGGPRLANRAQARQLRVADVRVTIRQASPSRARHRCLSVGVATITSTALADALDDTPLFTGCHDRIAC